jgi:16S rRNA (uracil1498-N3)-methyltransferase
MLKWRMEKSIFIPKKLALAECINLSDTLSEQIKSLNLLKLDSIVKITTPFHEHRARVVYMDKATVEVEILSIEELVTDFEGNCLTILQAVSGDRKFEYFLEKTIEVGVVNVFPIITDHMLIKPKQAYNALKDWQLQADKAIEQSRTRFPSRLQAIQKVDKQLVSELKKVSTSRPSLRIVLSTDLVDTQTWETAVGNFAKKYNYKFDLVVAIGPEKGWSSNELQFFKNNQFIFTSLGANILRTETAGVVVASIFNYISGFYK